MLEFHSAARHEATQALLWYAEQNVKVAHAFAAELQRAVSSIESDPSRLPTLGPELHFSRLKRFPYLLIFRIKPTAIQILAGAHSSRRPGYWTQRLTDTE